eukprot:scaffold217242_cov18-Tisochrysis_lutea.AAC.1
MFLSSLLFAVQWRQLLSGFAEVQSDRMDEMRQLELVLRALDAAATAGSELVDRSPCYGFIQIQGKLRASGIVVPADNCLSDWASV